MELGGHADHSWVRMLDADPESEDHRPNKKMRQVRSGHYVPVKPTPLPSPKLVIYSKRMAASLGLTDEDCHSGAFLSLFSGDVDAVPEMTSWATPYALAIMGSPMVQQCPFKNGNGYGDGRAISVGEVVVAGQRWELQLKGGGTTPFCRGADGRAVLRSSVREFLASEAMDALGVSTTRALCLIVSGSETAQRPWYSDERDDELPTEDDPRLAHYPPHVRKALLAQLASQTRDPDVMVTEKVAITTRVATSFTRIGHIDLFARRAARPGATELARTQHAAIVEHLLFREYPDVLPGAPLVERALGLIDAVANRIAAMVAGWLRIGFCQGNFNADNCLAGGRTMDYGPFGWMDKYDPKFAKWTGSGDHFAFMNQPQAGYVNFQTFATALDPLFDAESKGRAAVKVKHAKGQFDAAVADTWRRKLGFAPSDSASALASKLWSRLESLLVVGVDWTIGWRQLAAVLEAAAHAGVGMDAPSLCLEPLEPAFYKKPSLSTFEAWRMFVTEWKRGLEAHADPAEDVATELKRAAVRMRQENPKYVPREWMLVMCYDTAAKGDLGPLHSLHSLFETPYDEHPEMEAQFYRRAPEETLRKGGTAFMS